MGIYTDLAFEARELDPELKGISEERKECPEAAVTRIVIKTDEAAERMGKSKGTYITIDSPKLSERSASVFAAVSKIIADELKSILRGIKEDGPVLVVGLGNRYVTPDSLGPSVAESVIATRHINENVPELLEQKVRSVSVIAPGVMGSTGVETAEYVKGIAQRIRPGLIIAVDSLASRRAARISTTIQISDAGISPGAGVGNKRECINRDTIGVPVIAIGVPLVVYASTISRDAVSAMAKEAGIDEGEEKLRELIGRITDKEMEGLIVTPKDIDRLVADMSEVLASAINMALLGERYEELKALTE